jgi:GAF domain-containing protein
VTPFGGDRRLQILEKLVGTDSAALDLKQLCDRSVEVTEMSGAGIMLMSGDTPQGSLCTTNDVSAIIEDLQFTLGEGPCVDAYREDRPVLESDLLHPSVRRWVAFSGPAVDAGVRAVFGFPLQVGAVRLGALNLYRDHPGPLSDTQYGDALIVADITAQAVLAVQADASPGTLATALEANSNFNYVVHQASGMVAAQLGMTVGQALVRLRAHAFGSGQPLTAIANEVVARTLRFYPDQENPNP